MKTCRCSSWPSRLVAAALLCAVPRLAAADAFSPACDKGGDEMGFAIATNGDFNGDGVKDIAIGAPCTFVRQHPHAGRVIVVDGRNGHKLFRKRGTQENQWFGSAVSFIPDLNGDGRDEIAVGSPGYNVTIADLGDPLAKGLDRAGRVDVYQKHKRRLRIFGSNIRAGFGEKIAPLNDVNGDGRADFVVSASGDRNANGLTQPGRVYIVSGKNGDLLSYRIGPKEGNNYGRSLATAADLDGDGLVDFLVGSDLVNYPGVLRAGIVDALSSKDVTATPLFEVVGAHRDKIGKSLDFAGDVNGDGIPDVIVGSDGSDDTGVPLAGLVTLFSLDGTRLWVKPDTEIQEGARFGDAVARIGDINGDGVTDFGATASKQDFLIDKKIVPDAGRVVTLSGVDGTPIWSLNGERRHEEFGFALAGNIDFNLDEVPDLVVGTPGDDPFGRRGAGTARILSGVDGSQLFSIAGRRGLETRMVTALPDENGDPRVRSFSRTGRHTEMNASALAGTSVGEFSLAVLNDNPVTAQGDPHVPRPRSVEVAVAGGYGASNSTVEVYGLGSHGRLIDSFEAFPGQNFGVECGAGEVNGRLNEDLVCAQANSANGNVTARVFERLDEESSFFPSGEYQLFSDTDKLNGITPIAAEGADVAIGNVTGDKANEIVVGPTRGVPLVKIFGLDGVLIRSFLAYDPVEFSGVDIALADLDGSGDKWIVTAPRQGEALIKVFNGNGDRVGWGPANTLININPRPAPYNAGARVAAADVDLDDQQEILVLIPSPQGEAQVLAFEPNNHAVHGFTPFNPLALSKVGGAIAATDRWVRN